MFFYLLIITFLGWRVVVHDPAGKGAMPPSVPPLAAAGRGLTGNTCKLLKCDIFNVLVLREGAAHVRGSHAPTASARRARPVGVAAVPRGGSLPDATPARSGHLPLSLFCKADTPK